jgi:hypothetical protein
MGQTAGFAAGSWIVRQPPRENGQRSALLEQHDMNINLKLQKIADLPSTWYN